MQRKKNRYDDAFDNLWADQVSKPGEYSEFEREEAAIKIQSVMRGRQTRKDITGQSKKKKKENRRKQRKAEKEARKRKRREQKNIDNQEFIKTNTLSDLERKVAELEMKHVEKEKKGFMAGARNRIFGSSQPKKVEVIDHKKLREEREEAARKIQAIQRGKMGRKSAQQQKEKIIKREKDKQVRREQLKRENEERLLRNKERNAMYEEKRNARKQKMELQKKMDANYKEERRKKAEMRRRKNKQKSNAQQLLAQQRMIQYNAMVSIFNQFDGDGGGTISMYELRNMCIHMSQQNGLELPHDEELQQTINLMTKNKNATSITLSQFEDWVGTIFAMSKEQIICISRKSQFHQRYVNLIKICMTWLNNILENETLRQQYYDDNNFTNDSSTGLSPRQRRKQQALIQRQQEEAGYNGRNTSDIRVGLDVAAKRHQDIMETRRQKELNRTRQLEMAEKKRKEADLYSAKKSKEEYDRKIEMKQNNERRMNAIHQRRVEEHIKKQEEIDRMTEQILEKKGYTALSKNKGIDYDATASQLLGMSTSTKHYDMTLPRKKQRDVTEYYPGQQDVHSINQAEADITHWLFMENNTSNALSSSQRSIFLSSAVDNLQQETGEVVATQQQLNISQSGDWDDWNDDTSSSSLMQQGSSLMMEQSFNRFGGERKYENTALGINASKNALTVKSLFDFYSENKKNKKTKPLISRLAFIDFVDSLNLPLESRQYSRQQASLIYKNLTTEYNVTQMSFNIFQFALFEISKFIYNDINHKEAFNEFTTDYLKQAEINIKKKEAPSGSPSSMKNKVRSPTLGTSKRTGSPKHKFIRKVDNGCSVVKT